MAFHCPLGNLTVSDVIAHGSIKLQKFFVCIAMQYLMGWVHPDSVDLIMAAQEHHNQRIACQCDQSICLASLCHSIGTDCLTLDVPFPLQGYGGNH